MTGRSEQGEVAEPGVRSRSCRSPTWQCPGHKLRAGQGRMLSKALLPTAPHLLQGSPAPPQPQSTWGKEGEGRWGLDVAGYWEKRRGDWM